METGTVNLSELRTEWASELATAEQQIRELQVKIFDYKRKIAAIDTIAGTNTDQDTELETAEPEDESNVGEFTPVFAYWRPILEVLVEMGGHGKRGDIVDAVGQKMKGILKPADYGKLPTSGWIRWRNRVAWQASNMRQPEQGLIKSGSQRGIWEITDTGRKWLDDNKT